MFYKTYVCIQTHIHTYSSLHPYSVSRAVINKERDDEQYYILVEGLGLERVMGTPGVDGKNTVTNNIIETQKVLGIEAARCTIASEIKYVLTLLIHYIVIHHIRHLFCLYHT